MPDNIKEVSNYNEYIKSLNNGVPPFEIFDNFLINYIKLMRNSKYAF